MKKYESPTIEQAGGNGETQSTAVYAVAEGNFTYFIHYFHIFNYSYTFNNSAVISKTTVLIG